MSDDQTVQFGDIELWINEMIQPHYGSQATRFSRSTSGVKDAKTPNFSFVEATPSQELGGSVVKLSQTLYEDIHKMVESGDADEDGKIALLYLRYMGILSRQLVRSLTMKKRTAFNPLIISTQIECGIWVEHEKLMPDLSFTDDEDECHRQYSKHLARDNPEQMVQLHAKNMRDFFAKYERLCKNIKEDFKNEWTVYVDELAINLPTIYACLGRLSEAKKMIDLIDKKIGTPGVPNRECITKGKLALIRMSIELSPDFNVPAENKIQTACRKIEKYFDQGNLAFASVDIQFLPILSRIESINRALQMSRRRSKKVPNARSNSMGKRAIGGVDRPSKADKSKSPQDWIITQFSGLEKTMALLDDCKEMVGRGFMTLALGRFVYAQAGLIFTFSKALDHEPQNLPCVGPKELESVLKEMEELADFLQENGTAAISPYEAETEEDLEYFDVLYTHCLLHIATLQLQLGHFIHGKTVIDRCKKFAQHLNLFRDTLKEDIEQLEKVFNLHVERSTDYLFVFMTSEPIELLSEASYKQAHISDKPQWIFDLLRKQPLLLDAQFDAMTVKQFERVLAKGCKILHLMPPLELSSKHLVFELEDGRMHTLSSAEELNFILSRHQVPTLVILEQLNCKRFAEVFSEVASKQGSSTNIIHFYAKDFKRKSKLDQQYHLKELKKFTNHFCQTFFEKVLLFNDENQLSLTIKEAFNLSNSQTKKQNPSLKGQIQAELLQVGSNNYLYSQDDISSGLRPKDDKDYKKVVDVSRHQNMINKIIDPANGPTFVHNEDKAVQWLIHQLRHNSNSTLNVFGASGVGKTRLVCEASKWLFSRQHFSEVPEYYDIGKSIAASDGLTPVFKRYNIQKDEKTTWNAHSETSQTQRQLLILDNCDRQVQENPVSFFSGLVSILKHIEKLSLVLISQQKIDEKSYEQWMFNFNCRQVRPLGPLSHRLFIKQIIPKERHEELPQLEKPNVKGNPLLLEILVKIHSIYPDGHLLNKVKYIQAREAVETNFAVEMIEEGDQVKCSHYMVDTETVKSNLSKFVQDAMVKGKKALLKPTYAQQSTAIHSLGPMVIAQDIDDPINEVPKETSDSRSQSPAMQKSHSTTQNKNSTVHDNDSMENFKVRDDDGISSSEEESDDYLGRQQSQKMSKPGLHQSLNRHKTNTLNMEQSYKRVSTVKRKVLIKPDDMYAQSTHVKSKNTNDEQRLLNSYGAKNPTFLAQKPSKFTNETFLRQQSGAKFDRRRSRFIASDISSVLDCSDAPNTARARTLVEKELQLFYKSIKIEAFANEQYERQRLKINEVNGNFVVYFPQNLMNNAHVDRFNATPRQMTGNSGLAHTLPQMHQRPSTKSMTPKMQKRPSQLDSSQVTSSFDAALRQQYFPITKPSDFFKIGEIRIHVPDLVSQFFFKLVNFLDDSKDKTAKRQSQIMSEKQIESSSSSSDEEEYKLSVREDDELEAEQSEEYDELPQIIKAMKSLGKKGRNLSQGNNLEIEFLKKKSSKVTAQQSSARFGRGSEPAQSIQRSDEQFPGLKVRQSESGASPQLAQRAASSAGSHDLSELSAGDQEEVDKLNTLILKLAKKRSSSSSVQGGDLPRIAAEVERTMRKVLTRTKSRLRKQVISVRSLTSPTDSEPSKGDQDAMTFAAEKSKRQSLQKPPPTVDNDEERGTVDPPKIPENNSLDVEQRNSFKKKRSLIRNRTADADYLKEKMENIGQEVRITTPEKNSEKNRPPSFGGQRSFGKDSERCSEKEVQEKRKIKDGIQEVQDENDASEEDS